MLPCSSTNFSTFGATLCSFNTSIFKLFISIPPQSFPYEGHFSFIFCYFLFYESSFSSFDFCFWMSITTKVSTKLVALEMDVSSKSTLFLCLKLLICWSKLATFVCPKLGVSIICSNPYIVVNIYQIIP